MGQYVDYYCGNENERLKTIVSHIIKKKFGWLPEGYYDDFYSIAGEVVWKCEKNFDANKCQSFQTYLTSCLQRKIKSRITYINREKRGGGVYNISLDALVDDDSDTTLGELIPAQQKQSDVSESAQEYLDSLSKKQREVADLLMAGYTPKEIKHILHLSDKRYDMLLQRMRSDEKVGVLLRERRVRSKRYER